MDITEHPSKSSYKKRVDSVMSGEWKVNVGRTRAFIVDAHGVSFIGVPSWASNIVEHIVELHNSALGIEPVELNDAQPD